MSGFLRSENRAEIHIRIRRHNEPCLLLSTLKNVGVSSRVHPVSTEMSSVGPGLLPQFRQTWRKRIVDEKSHRNAVAATRVPSRRLPRTSGTRGYPLSLGRDSRRECQTPSARQPAT